MLSGFLFLLVLDIYIYRDISSRVVAFSMVASYEIRGSFAFCDLFFRYCGPNSIPPVRISQLF